MLSRRAATRADTELFVGRTEEQQRFREVLKQARLRRLPGPDEGFVVLVHGHGGIGKTKLLARFRRIAAGELPDDRANRGRFLLASVDWELEQRRNPTDFAGFGGPIWRVLDRLYRAVLDGTNQSKRKRRKVERAFDRFRQRMTLLPELEERAQRLGLEAVVGRRRLTAKELEPFLQAAATVSTGAAQLAGASAVVRPPAKAVAGLAQAAELTLAAAQQHRHGRVDASVYESLTGEVDALVRAFAEGLRQVGRTIAPVVMLLDTCELLADTGEWLREVMRQAGARTVWVLGLRLESEADAGLDSEGAHYRRDLHEQRLSAIALARFDDQTLEQYLHDRLGGALPEGISIDAIARLTRGVPLAAYLVSRILPSVQHPDALLREVSDTGEVSQVIAELARRYLLHALTVPELAGDLPLLYGLALLHGDQLDPQLLAVLWDTPAGEVPGQLRGLARRHDFVLSATQRMHQDIRDTIRTFLLDAVERQAVVPMSQRAVAHLRAQQALHGPHELEAQLADPDWQASVLALVWHSFWAEPRTATRLLYHLFPAAALLAPSLAVGLADIAEFFSPVCLSADRQVLASLRSLQEGIGVLGRRRRHGARPGPGELRAAVRTLTTTQPTASVLADDLPYAALLHLLQAANGRQLGLEAVEQLQHLEQAAALLPAKAASQTALTLSRHARQLADALVFSGYGGTPVASEPGLRAARLATAHDPADASSWDLLGVALAVLGRREEAERAFHEAIRLNPTHASAHSNLGVTLHNLGRYEEAERVYREAIRLDPTHASAHNNLGELLVLTGHHESARASLERVAELRPEDALEAQVMLGALLRREDSSRAAQRFASALDCPGATVSPFRRAEMWSIALAALGRVDEAAGKLRAAGPDWRPGDRFDKPLYDLLADPPLPGLDQLLAIWQQVIAANPNVLRPWGDPAPKGPG